MSTTESLQKQLKGLLTISDLRKQFGLKTGSRIHYLRTHKGLPAVILPGEPYPVIRFVPKDVQDWAKKNRELLASRRVIKTRRSR